MTHQAEEAGGCGGVWGEGVSKVHKKKGGGWGGIVLQLPSRVLF